MKESIFKSMIKRFFIVLATVTATIMGIILAFQLMGALSSLFFAKDLSSGENSSLTMKIQPNALGSRKTLPKTAPVILKIAMNGVIGTEKLTYQKIEEILLASREASLAKDRVKGIIITMNSPGGSATASDSIYHALKTYKERYKTPIYTHVDGLCASGGMYIACAADKVYATDASIVGSIGVVTPPIFNFSSLMEKIGVESKTLLAGKGKDELNPFRPWIKNEGENYQLAIDHFYSLFVNIITTNRKNVDKDKLINEYGAGIFPAFKAQEIGFIDGSNMTYNETLELLANEIGVKSDEYQVVSLKADNWFKNFLKAKTSSPLVTGTVVHRFEFPGQLDANLTNQFLYLYRYDQ